MWPQRCLSSAGRDRSAFRQRSRSRKRAHTWVGAIVACGSRRFDGPTHAPWIAEATAAAPPTIAGEIAAAVPEQRGERPIRFRQRSRARKRTHTWVGAIVACGSRRFEWSYARTLDRRGHGGSAADDRGRDRRSGA
jgi:hypothetical protein